MIRRSLGVSVLGIATAAAILGACAPVSDEAGMAGTSTVEPSALGGQAGSPSEMESAAPTDSGLPEGWIVVACAEGQPTLPPGTQLTGSITWHHLNPGFAILPDGRCAVDPSETPQPIVMTDAETGASWTVEPIPTIDPESGATFWTLPDETPAP